MEFQKIANFLDTTFDDKDLPRFVTKTWVEVYDQSGGNYNVNKEIRIKTSMLRSDLCDYSDACIVVKGTITVDKKTFTADNFEAHNNTAAYATATSTANKSAFGEKKLVFKNNFPFINCIYFRDEPNSDTDDHEIKYSIINSKSFNYKVNFIGSVTYNNLTKNIVKIVVPLKYLSNFWRSLNIPLIVK